MRMGLLSTAVKVGSCREGTQQAGTWVSVFSSGEWPKSIRSGLQLSPSLNPTRIKSTTLFFYFFFSLVCFLLLYVWMQGLKWKKFHDVWLRRW